MFEHTIIAEQHGFALLHDTEHDTYRVVGIDRQAGKVTSAMPSDKPARGGCWFGALTDSGVRYVANGYSRSYARRRFREFANERASHLA